MNPILIAKLDYASKSLMAVPRKKTIYVKQKTVNPGYPSQKPMGKPENPANGVR